MIVAGVMSGTSADGIDVALVDIRGQGASLKLKFLAHEAFPYSERVREAALSAMNAQSLSVADLSRLHFLLTELYADAIIKTQKRHHTKAALVGCHGQTIYHQGDPALFIGRNIAVTMQIGEGAVIAARTGLPVVSDFRPADIAAGGKGAPLVPFLDCLVYRHPRFGRIALNLGGIANLTAIPSAAKPTQVTAFDIGPGNMLIDALTDRLFQQPYDRDGRIASRGNVLDTVVQTVLREAFFHKRPPKTTGREQFGAEFADRFLRLCGNAKKEDIIATATALTSAAIILALKRFVLQQDKRYKELIVSGGGTRNRTLMKMLQAGLIEFDIKLRHSDGFGLPSQAKEAAAFALLAYETWHRRPSNIPSATGAKRPAILGKISYV
jgi:anhydro-N-acetylmuramic acid kinase